MQLQVQPHDDALEESILGCLIEHPKTYWDIEAYLYDSTTWYGKRTRELYKLIGQMIRNGDEIDLPLVCASVPQSKKELITSFWVSGLPKGAAMPSTVVSHAKKLYEQSIFRKTIVTAEKIKTLAYDGNQLVYDILADSHQMIGSLLELRPSMGFDFEKIIHKAIQEIIDRDTNLVKSGYSGIDTFAGGFTKGEVSIVGGRPGHGKSTFLINLAANLVGDGYRVILFNRELPNTEVVKKLICLESLKLSYHMIRNGEYDKSGEVELQKVSKLLKEKYTSDSFAMYDSIPDFRQSMVEVKKFKPDVVIDDYIQLIQPTPGIDTRRLQLERICNDYKWLAKTQKCSVILASQLNRQLEYRNGKDLVPQLSDLAESGAIEQVAENVYFVHYHHKMKPDDKKSSPNKITLYAKKVRYGKTGSHVLGYDGDKCKIYGTYSEYEDSLRN